MEPVVVALVLASAVLHLAWNVLLKTSGDPLLTAGIGMLAGTLVAVPVGLATLAWTDGGLVAGASASGVALLALASGLVETAYFVLLSRAYRHGDLSVVYPTARGTAPLVAVAIGVVVLGERLGVVGALGVAALLLGIVVLQRPWRLLLAGGADRSARIAATAAIATGVAIAAYSTLDRVAVRSVSPAVYAAVLWPVMTVGVGLWIASRRPLDRRMATSSTARPDDAVTAPLLLATQLGATAAPAVHVVSAVHVPRALLGGLLTYAAYAMVLIALAVAPLTAVAPLRETAVVLAAAWGALQLGEAMDRRDVARRVAAAGLVVLGVALLLLDAA